jgi:hypothetical protein
MSPNSGSTVPTGSRKPTIQIVSVEDASGLSWLLLRDYEPINRFDEYEDAEAMMQQMLTDAEAMMQQMLTGDAPLNGSPVNDNGQGRHGLSRFFGRR